MAEIGRPPNPLPSWIDEGIEREATPKQLRAETTTAFCARVGVERSTYYYEMQKKDVFEKIEDLCFKQAKKHTADILDALGQRAKTDNKASELFLEFILERKKRVDITTKDETLNAMSYEKARAIIAGKGSDTSDSKE